MTESITFIEIIMDIVRIQNWQFIPRDQFDDVIRSISLNEHLVNVFYNFSIKHYKNRKICQRAVSELPKSQNKIENSCWFVFYCLFLLRPIVKIVCILFKPHCIISASIQDFELKLRTQTKFDTLISNLKLNFHYGIVMTS